MAAERRVLDADGSRNVEDRGTAKHEESKLVADEHGKPSRAASRRVNPLLSL